MHSVAVGIVVDLCIVCKISNPPPHPATPHTSTSPPLLDSNGCRYLPPGLLLHMSTAQYEYTGQAHQEAAGGSPFAMEIIDSVPGRVGSVILRSSDGATLHRDGQLSDHDASILYQMLREIGEVVPDDEGLRRVEVSFQAGFRYTVVLVDEGLDGFVYIVKRRSAE